jgi:hypothetical protein
MPQCTIPNDSAHIVFHNDVYHIYRNDGWCAVEVMTARTLEGAITYCIAKGWKIIQ